MRLVEAIVRLAVQCRLVRLAKPLVVEIARGAWCSSPVWPRSVRLRKHPRRCQTFRGVMLRLTVQSSVMLRLSPAGVMLRLALQSGVMLHLTVQPGVVLRLTVPVESSVAVRAWPGHDCAAMAAEIAPGGALDTSPLRGGANSRPLSDGRPLRLAGGGGGGGGGGGSGAALPGREPGTVQTLGQRLTAVTSGESSQGWQGGAPAAALRSGISIHSSANFMEVLMVYPAGLV